MATALASLPPAPAAVGMEVRSALGSWESRSESGCWGWAHEIVFRACFAHESSSEDVLLTYVWGRDELKQGGTLSFMFLVLFILTPLVAAETINHSSQSPFSPKWRLSLLKLVKRIHSHIVTMINQFRRAEPLSVDFEMYCACSDFPTLPSSQKHRMDQITIRPRAIRWCLYVVVLHDVHCGWPHQMSNSRSAIYPTRVATCTLRLHSLWMQIGKYLRAISLSGTKNDDTG